MRRVQLIPASLGVGLLLVAGLPTTQPIVIGFAGVAWCWGCWSRPAPHSTSSFDSGREPSNSLRPRVIVGVDREAVGAWRRRLPILGAGGRVSCRDAVREVARHRQRLPGDRAGRAAGRGNAARVQRICHPDLGAGSDGILLIGDGQDAGQAVRIFNPDGGEAEFSGNGTRIAAGYLMERDGAGRGGDAHDQGHIRGERHGDVITIDAGSASLESPPTTFPTAASRRPRATRSCRSATRTA